MLRSAKQSLTFKKIATEVLEDLPEDVRLLKCPMNYKPNADGLTSIVRCCTTCNTKCTQFVSFRWVIEMCRDRECQYDTPCLYCLELVADLKVAIKALSIANRAFIGEYSSQHMVREWAYRRSR
jgi:hypothetical protein